MPTNILKSVEEAAAKEIIKYRHKMMQQVNSGLDKIKDIEFPDMKKKFEQAEEEFNKSMEDRLNQELSNGAQHFTEIKNDISTLGTDLGLLQESTMKFAKRSVLIVPSIISSGPLGPSIAPQQLPALTEELTQEMEEMTSLSTRCKNMISKLQLDKISGAIGISTRGSNPLSSILSISDSVTSQAEQAMSDVQNAMSGFEVPDNSSEEPKAENCENYAPLIPASSPSATNCSKYSPMNSSEGRDCKNCSRFYPMNIDIKCKGWIHMKSRSMQITNSEEFELTANPIFITSEGPINTDSNIITINSGSDINLKAKGDINMDSENNNTTSNKDANLVYKEGMNIIVESGDASITTKNGTFKLDISNDVTFKTKENLITEVEKSTSINTGSYSQTSGGNTDINTSGTLTMSTSGSNNISADSSTNINTGSDLMVTTKGDSSILTDNEVTIKSNKSGINISSEVDIDVKSRDGNISIITESSNEDSGKVTINSSSDINSHAKRDSLIISDRSFTQFSKDEMTIAARGILTLDASEIEFKGVRPVADVSGALNCVPKCPFTGVLHWANLSKKIER